jgi:glucan biosynthesis protein
MLWGRGDVEFLNITSGDDEEEDVSSYWVTRMNLEDTGI